MSWLEITINTQSSAIAETTAVLTAGGFAELVIEDQAEFEEFLDQNRAYWDYIDEDLLREQEILTSPEAIEKTVVLHQYVVENNLYEYDTVTGGAELYDNQGNSVHVGNTWVTFRYNMKNGNQISRRFSFYLNQEAADLMNAVVIDPEYKDDGALLDYSSVSTNIEDILPQARKITDSIHQALSLRNHAMLEGRVDELLHFLKLRTCNRAQWEIRGVANTMLRLCREVLPEVFDHGGARCERLGWCPEGEKFTCGRYPLPEQRA